MTLSAMAELNLCSRIILVGIVPSYSEMQLWLAMQRLCGHLALVSCCPPEQDVKYMYVPEVPASITYQCLELAMIGKLSK